MPAPPGCDTLSGVTTEPSGTVAACWRYPVKSFQGLPQDQLRLEPTGVVGDRTFGLIDVEVDRLLSAKRTAALLEASATDDTVTLPDGTVHAVDDPGLDQVLSVWIGRPVRFARADATGPVSYQMTFDPPNDEAELFDIPAPEGTFLDIAAVHVVTTATLQACADARPDVDWDVRRFRPNLVLDGHGPAFHEQDWIGHEIRVGPVVLRVDGPMVRCAMPLRAQPGGLDRQPQLFHALNDLNPTFPGHLGLCCSVVTPGTVAVADPVIVP
jgi:uncharacterized protein YcbX